MSDEEDQEDDAGSEAPRWAADEPTAMWSEADMKDGGYDALADDRAASPRGQTGPATERGVGGLDDSSIQLSADATGGHPAVAPPTKTGGISWVLTVAISLGLGFGVYLLVRLLR